MNLWKIAGIAIVALWMALTSWRLEYAIQVAEAACSTATIADLNSLTHRFKNTLKCPFPVDLEYPDDIKPLKP